MRLAPVADEKRLALLNHVDDSHAWHSCDELRYCILCDQVFSGHDVKLSWFRKGHLRLHCPTPNCPGSPATWVHPDNPLVSDEAWQDWERIILYTETHAS